MRESNVMRQCWLALARVSTLFRLNTGQAWAGKAQRQPDGSVLLLPGARPVTLGFGMPDGKPLAGASDLIGWTEVVVTQQMVGTRLPVFTGIETKESGGGRKSDDQINFVDRVRKVGGIAGFAPSAAVAQSIVSDWARARGAVVGASPT